MIDIQRVRQFVIDNFLFGDGERLDGQTSFLEGGIIDSTGVLELIAFLESTFHIKIEDHELAPENLDSLECIEDYLKRKLNSHSGLAPT